MQNFNFINIRIITFKPFEGRPDKKAIKMDIVPRRRKNHGMDFKLKDLQELFESVGFNKEFIYFEGMSGDEWTNLFINRTHYKKYISFIKEDLLKLKDYKHYITIDYGLQIRNGSPMEWYDVSKVGRFFKMNRISHRSDGSSSLTFVLKNDKNKNKGVKKIFFNNEYILKTTVKNMVYIDHDYKKIESMMYRKYTYGKKDVDEINPKYFKYIRAMKLKKIL